MQNHTPQNDRPDAPARQTAPQPRRPRKTKKKAAPHRGGAKAKNGKKSHPPHHVEPLYGIFRSLPCERLLNEPQRMLNRYGLYTILAGGQFFGFAAHIRIAIARIFDALRLHYGDALPEWLREWTKYDSLSLGDLRSAYAGSKDVWMLDLSAFVPFEHRKRIGRKQLIPLLLHCIVSIFKGSKVYVGAQEKQVKVAYGPPDEIPRGQLRNAIEGALIAVECYRARQAAGMDKVPVPGWKSACQTKFEVDAFTARGEDEQREGRGTPTFWRLTIADKPSKSGKSQNNLKGQNLPKSATVC